jgi:hypothetical protein
VGDALLDRLEYKTWLQLKECTYVAMTALRQMTGDDQARRALEKIEHILSEQWEGPGTP